VREWFAEVQRRLDAGADPFLEADATGKAADGAAAGARGEVSAAGEEQTATGMGDEEDEDEGDEEEEEDGGGDDTDDSEVWEPSRSVRKSLSVSED